MEDIINQFATFVIDDEAVIIFQSWTRLHLQTINNLPNTTRRIQQILQKSLIAPSKEFKDGRTCSSKDEDVIINTLSEMKERLFIPKSRHWFDLAVFDYRHGWLPVNIKSTTTKSADNIGNLSTCVYALNDENLDLKKSYNNGEMATLLINSIQEKKYNTINKKDYYFVVLNKTTNEIIINSIKGLEIMTPNINNLPFQINWKKNSKFKYQNTEESMKKFINCFPCKKTSWKEEFLLNMRSINQRIT